MADYNLKPRERKFADEYMSNGRNATQAYRSISPRAKDTTCAVQGLEYLRKPNISRYIKDKTKERLDASNLTVNDVIDELITIGFGKKLKGLYRRFNKLTGEYDADDEFEFTAKDKERKDALVALAELIRIEEEKGKDEAANIVIVDSWSENDDSN